jgi:uncharacterized repeat protein (TIGR03847 family)
VQPLQRREFDDVVRVEAEAIGPPGRRRFRLVVSTMSQAALLWMEKQQLQALGIAFEQILTQLEGAGVVADLVPITAEQPERPVIFGPSEYQVGRLAVGFDEERNLITILAHEITDEDDENPSFVCHITPEQSGALALQIRRTVTSGARQHSNGHLPH